MGLPGGIDPMTCSTTSGRLTTSYVPLPLNDLATLVNVKSIQTWLDPFRSAYIDLILNYSETFTTILIKKVITYFRSTTFKTESN